MKLNDFEYIQKESNPKGKVIIVGMMEDGPTAQPFRLINEGSAKFLLGDNEVSRAFDLLILNGIPIENIILFRLNGTPSYAELEIDNKPVITFQSLVSNTEENKVTITVSDEGLSIFSNYSESFIEEEKRKDFKRTYRFDEYPYMANLAEAVTKDAILGFHPIVSKSEESILSSALSGEVGPTAFREGNSETSLTVKDGLFGEGNVEEEGTFTYDYWQKFYNHLLGVNFDGESSSNLMDIAAEVIYFVDAPIIQLSEIVTLAGRVAYQKTETQDVVCTSLFTTPKVPEIRELQEGEYLGEDGTFYNIDTGEIETWEPKKEQNIFINQLSNLFTLEEQSYKEMANVQIVVGEDRAPGNTSENPIEYIPGATYHLVNLLKEELKSSTNKELIGFSEINSPLDKNQIAKLSNKGYICIVGSIRRNVVTSKVKTLYIGQEKTEEFYFKKMLSYISYDIRLFLDKYIGSTLSIYNLSQIENTLEEYLQGYVDARLIQSFTLGERVNEDLEYSSSISINIVAYGEIDNIKGSAQLSESGWEVDLWATTN